ncbi:type I restriction endonuclease subunit S [Ensifer sp. MPMI2T]|nr:type I restriction endonuclease subunit S [Ensifer sp. MPMI2T]
MSELPRGWAEASLGDVCDLQNGRAYKQEELLSSGKYPVLRVGNFFTSQKWYYSDLELEPTKYCDNGDLLYAWSASFGPRIWSGGKVIFHYHIWRVDLEGAVSDRDFVFHWFNWDKENIKAAHGTGSTMIHVTKGDMEQRKILLPPLAEQKRIVAKLDALNAKSARARTELARIETLVSRYKQAVLSKAFSGELTREWRSRQAKLVPWENVPLSQLVSDGPSNGWSPKADGKAGGLKSLKLSATSSGSLRLDESTIKYLDQTLPQDSKFWLLSNDILIQRANSLELLGTTVLFDGPPHEFIFPDLMMRIRANHKKAIPRYLATYLNSDPARSYFRANATGTAGNMPKINGTTVRETRVPTPPLEEQHEIVRRIESAFDRVDRLAAEARRALELVGKLDEAILANAFRGELVPQDENDEPAEKLLERIRAERAAAPKAKRGRR